MQKFYQSAVPGGFPGASGTPGASEDDPTVEEVNQFTTGVAADPAFVAATMSAGPQPALMYSAQAAPVMLPPLDYHGLDVAQPSPNSVKLVSDFFHDKEPNELI
ncbi:hypothetical protein DFH11DRAFT_1616646 [Phellopilus nigrolimitatus]|nr:hypothetical protein DFH11DRAFT_1616646 [Phellopilus nigrolimitatus]